LPFTDLETRQKYQKYYMRVYRANDVEKASLKELLHDVLKLTFERDFLAEQWVCSHERMGPVATKSDQLIATIVVKTAYPEDLPNIKVKPKVLEPLIPFYSRVAREFHQRYRSRVSSEAVEKKVRQLQTLMLEQLQSVKQSLQKEKDKYLVLRVYQELEKAGKVLEQRFGHPDFTVQNRMLEPFRVSVEKRESLWLEAMEHLHGEGFTFFESNLAAAKLAFELGTPDDPYVYGDNGDTHALHHLTTIKPLENPLIVEWRKSEGEDVAIKNRVWREYWRQNREKQRREAKFKKALREWLIPFIRNGYDLEDLEIATKRANYSKEETELTFRLWDQLHREGVKPKILRIKIVEDQADLDRRWLACMAVHSGKPDHEGHKRRVDDFDSSVQTCTYSVFSQTGKQPSPATFERAKKFWQPGYWETHTLGDNEHE
jgi:hypothetical protein